MIESEQTEKLTICGNRLGLTFVRLIYTFQVQFERLRKMYKIIATSHHVCYD